MYGKLSQSQTIIQKKPHYLASKKLTKLLLRKRLNHTYQRLFFTIEAIKKVERQDFFSSTKAKVVVKEKVQSDNSISVNYTVGPNEDDAIHFKERPILKRYFYEAIKLGFNIVRLPRVGGLMNPEVDTVRFKQDDHNLSIFLKKAFDAISEASKKWTMPIRNWKLALNHFIIEFEEQLRDYI